MTQLIRQDLVSLINSIEEILPNSSLSAPLHDADIYAKLFRYYTMLAEKFPDKITWDGDEFSFKEWDLGSYVMDYRLSSGELSLTPAMFSNEDRDFLHEALKGITSHNPANLILPIPMLKVKVPFLDVKRISYAHFASNDE